VASEEAFIRAAFDRLQQQGAPALVWVHADWRPTCRAREPILKIYRGAGFATPIKTWGPV